MPTCGCTPMRGHRLISMLASCRNMNRAMSNIGAVRKCGTVPQLARQDFSVASCQGLPEILTITDQNQRITVKALTAQNSNWLLKGRSTLRRPASCALTAVQVGLLVTRFNIAVPAFTRNHGNCTSKHDCYHTCLLRVSVMGSPAIGHAFGKNACVRTGTHSSITTGSAGIQQQGPGDDGGSWQTANSPAGRQRHRVSEA
jgi:hypothetical protein